MTYYETETCLNCQGKGHIIIPDSHYVTPGHSFHMEICPGCHGAGTRKTGEDDVSLRKALANLQANTFPTVENQWSQLMRHIQPTVADEGANMTVDYNKRLRNLAIARKNVDSLKAECRHLTFLLGKISKELDDANLLAKAHEQSIIALATIAYLENQETAHNPELITKAWPIALTPGYVGGQFAVRIADDLSSYLPQRTPK